MAHRASFGKMANKSDSPILMYLALATTVGFFLVMAAYALF
jgi:hypothetical protein